MQTEIQITNWRLSRLTFLPSRTIAEPSSPSRVRCAASNPRRALDCSGRFCKISLLGRKVDLRKAKKQRQNQNLLDIHRHSHGRAISLSGTFHGTSHSVRTLQPLMETLQVDHLITTSLTSVSSLEIIFGPTASGVAS